MPESTKKAGKQNADELPGGEEPRIGVYTCYCGGNISDVVSCEKVAKELSREANVVVSRTDMSIE